MQNINKEKCWVFKKINKSNKHLGRPNKKQREKNQRNKIRDESEDIITKLQEYINVYELLETTISPKLRKPIIN